MLLGLTHGFRKLFSRLVAGHSYPSKAQDQITVVLIDDQFLDRQGEHWPPSYGAQAGWWAEILLYEPKAVFIDFLYRRRHGSDEELAQLTGTINSFKDDIPIYIPSAVKTTDTPNCHPKKMMVQRTLRNETSVIKEIQGVVEKPTYIKWFGCGDRYPMYLGNNTEFPTPAFSMFETYCTENKDADVCINIDKLASHYSEPMVIRWGSRISEMHRESMAAAQLPCDDFGFIDHFLQLLSQVFEGLPERGKRSPCTYTDTLHASWLLFSFSENKEGEGAVDPLEPFFRGRYVFIGSQIEGSADYITNPINGKVPGVYLFAFCHGFGQFD